MTNEDYFRERFLVLSTYPDSPYQVGDILTTDSFLWKNSNYGLISPYVKNFPHIFRKLEWWEERPREDMPMYVKQVGMVDDFDRPIPDWFIKIKKHFTAGNGEWRDDSYKLFCCDKDDRTIGYAMNYSSFVPATEEEYNNKKAINHARKS